MDKRLIISLLLLLAFCEIRAQSRYRVGPLPSINLNQKINSDWRLNVKVESRQFLRVGRFGQPSKAEFEYERMDVSAISSRKAGANSKLAGGIMLRQRGRQFLFRSIQQYSIVRPRNGYRLGHRFSADQTFEAEVPVLYRFRYRIGADFALNGQAVDRREFYGKLTNEYLAVLQGADIDLEIRLVPSIGYAYTDNNKLELGLDYRLDSIFTPNLRSNFWISLGWYISLQ